MHEVWFQAALWVGLALVATLLSIWLRISVALTEIVIGVIGALVVGASSGTLTLETGAPWVKFLAGTGAIVLTFLAGAELDPKSLRKNWLSTSILGLIAFASPFFGAAAAARYLLGWDVRAAWLAGVALSTTSVAVVYAVMLELGLNASQFGKIILAACFVNDLGTVIALGLLFSPFTWRTACFVAALLLALFILLRTTRRVLRRYGGRTSEFEAKYLLFVLFVLGGLAVWAGSEAVLPAYLAGMILAGAVGSDHMLVRRLRTLTFGLLTPFYFIRAGSLVQMPILMAGFGTFLVLLAAKMATKFIAVYPVCRGLRYGRGESMYTTMMMSTGLTFGTISALFGLSHGIISQGQYSLLVAAVIASAVIPTWIGNRFFMPRQHLPVSGPPSTPAPAASPVSVGVHAHVQADSGRF